MNYISRLQSENVALQARIAAIETSLRETLGYLSSSKFADGELAGYVSTSDASRRINEALQADGSLLEIHLQSADSKPFFKSAFPFLKVVRETPCSVTIINHGETIESPHVYQIERLAA